MSGELNKCEKENQHLLSKITQLKKILNLVPSMIYIVDLETYRILYVNDTLQNKLNRQITGQLCYDVLHNELNPCEFCKFSLLNENPEEIVDWEEKNPVLNKDLLIHEQIMEWDEGRKVCLKIALDLNLQKKMEAHIEEIEFESQKSFINNKEKMELLSRFPGENPNPILQISIDGELRYSNNAATKIMHYLIDSPSQFLNKNLSTILKKVVEKKLLQIIEYPILERIYSIIFVPIENFQLVNLYISDITEKKNAEIALLNSKTELEFKNTLLEAFLYFSTDEMYHQILKILLKLFNSKFGVFGYLDEEGSLVVPSMTREIWEKCQVQYKHYIFPRKSWGKSLWPEAIRQKGLLFSNNPSTLTPSGHLPITRNISAAIIYHDEPIGLIQVANKETDYTNEDIEMMKKIIQIIGPILNARLERDFQERKRIEAEEKLNNTMQNLKRSNEELEQYAYVSSHQLQEPLRLITSYVQLIEKRYNEKLDEEGREFLHYIVEGTKRMKNLIDDFLSYSRLNYKSVIRTEVDLNQLLPNILKDLDLLIKDTHTLITFENLPVINCERNQIEQLFENLINNAIKFHKKDIFPVINISYKSDPTHWIFCIEDNGIGIDPQYFNRLFQMFQQLNRHDEYPGTGIGLPICKRIVELHSGKLWVESQLGVGSKFYFSISK